MTRPPRGSLPLPGLRWRGLSLQFFTFFVIPLAGLLLLATFGSLALHQRAMRQMVGERDARAVRTAAAAIGGQISHRAVTLRSVGLYAAESAAPETILSETAFLADDFDLGLALYASDGRLLASNGAAAQWNGSNESLLSLRAQALAQAGQNPVFSSLITMPNNQKAVLAAFAAASDAPIVIGAFDPAALTAGILSETFPSGGGATVFVVTADGRIVYQNDAGLNLDAVRGHPGVAEALRGEHGVIYAAPQRDEPGRGERVIAFNPIAPAGWALVMEEPWSSVATPFLNTTQMAPLILVPALLLSLLALWFGARRIIQPLQDLEARAGKLAWGDYEAIQEEVGGIEEIRRLQRTLIHLAEKIRRAQEGLRGYIGAITTGQEEERRRLARELHDDTIQALIALNQRVQLAQLQAQDGEIAAPLDEIHRLTENTIQGVRRMTRALRPLYLEDLGLAAALEMLTRETADKSDLEIAFRQSGAPQRLPADVELALYRIAQEALHNVQRHADARHVEVALRFERGQVVLQVQDDGAGFTPPDNPAEFALGGHFGLLGMHERAELMGARLDIQSAPGQGARLTVTLPLEGGG